MTVLDSFGQFAAVIVVSIATGALYAKVRRSSVPRTVVIRALLIGLLMLAAAVTLLAWWFVRPNATITT